MPSVRISDNSSFQSSVNRMKKNRNHSSNLKLQTDTIMETSMETDSIYTTLKVFFN